MELETFIIQWKNVRFENFRRFASYEHIYCRYLAPGECIVHDHGGEFTSKLQKKN